LGFETVAIARDADKEADARNLGAHHYIDSTAGDIGAALKALGGATVVLAAVANSKAMADTVRVIAPQGELVIIGVTADPLPISPMDLIDAADAYARREQGEARYRMVLTV
jgi:alcohol dehydrogenase